jgi:hypothetical protein
MSSGAYALYIDPQAGGMNNPQVQRVIPLPHIGNQEGIHFDHRRLTLAYDNFTNGSASIQVMVRFIDDNHMVIGSPQTLPIRIGCTPVPIPPTACLASFEVNAAPAGETPPHGSLTALVEYNS